MDHNNIERVIDGFIFYQNTNYEHLPDRESKRVIKPRHSTLYIGGDVLVTCFI